MLCSRCVRTHPYELNILLSPLSYICKNTLAEWWTAKENWKWKYSDIDLILNPIWTESIFYKLAMNQKVLIFIFSHIIELRWIELLKHLHANCSFYVFLITQLSKGLGWVPMSSAHIRTLSCIKHAPNLIGINQLSHDTFYYHANGDTIKIPTYIITPLSN